MSEPSPAADLSKRSKTVDYDRINALQLLGNYCRRLPVNMARMMENALDWEHLPYVHGSSFGTIEALDKGSWGWRARTTPPGGAGEGQLIELLLDQERHYWATSVLAGPAAEVEIHTQASETGPGEIEVDVRFYSTRPLPEEEAALYHEVLAAQYALLYDEDEWLMTGREAALADRERWAQGELAGAVLVGELEQLHAQGGATVDTGEHRYRVRLAGERWLVHSAVCPHLLGPLEDAVLDGEGAITCPWHGFRFDVHTGANLDGRCRALAPAPALREEAGRLYLLAVEE